MKNEEEKNELCTVSCYKLHFGYSCTLNLADFKYIIIFSITMLHQNLKPIPRLLKLEHWLRNGRRNKISAHLKRMYFKRRPLSKPYEGEKEKSGRLS